MLLKKFLNKIMPGSFLLLSGMALPIISMAEDNVPPKVAATVTGDGYDIARYSLMGMMVLLLCVIAILGNAVSSAGKICWDRERRKKKDTISYKVPILILLFLLTAFHHPATAEEITETVKSKGSPVDIYILLITVALEFIVILVLAKMLLRFLDTRSEEAKAGKKIQLKVLLRKLNQTVAVEEEHLLDLHHDYDGIRELDNKVPAWWRYAFYASILFGVVYLYRMFVSESLPDQLRELDAANEIAALQKAEYLKNAANNIDENNVAMLDATGISEGGALFVKNCQACHGDKGQGGVGPNLTDDYWLHKGSIKNVFYSIKYGWQEKGMKSWKDDFSPVQIAQLASFVKSLHGTKPAGGKEPQGALYTEEAVASSVKDTATVNAH